MKKTIIDLFEASVRKYGAKTFLLEKRHHKFEPTTYAETREQALEAGAGHFPRGGAAAGQTGGGVHRDRGFAERPAREQARRMPDAVRAGPLAAGGGAPGAL